MEPVTLFGVPLRMTCERCGRRIRWIDSAGDVRDRIYGNAPAEIDPDLCTGCGEDAIRACEAHEEAPTLAASALGARLPAE